MFWRVSTKRGSTCSAWGEGRARDDRDEVRAAGHAILLLIEEIEHLHVDL
jgi:hypothetical protein